MTILRVSIKNLKTYQFNINKQRHIIGITTSSLDDTGQLLPHDLGDMAQV